MEFQQFLIDPRFVIESFQMCEAHHLAQMPIALAVFDQHGQVRQKTLFVGCPFLETAVGQQIHFTTDNRFDPLGRHRLIKFEGPEEIAVIGHCHCRHFHLMNFVGEGINRTRPIEKTVIGVDMQMDEIRMLHIIQGESFVFLRKCKNQITPKNSSPKDHQCGEDPRNDKRLQNFRLFCHNIQWPEEKCETPFLCQWAIELLNSLSDLAVKSQGLERLGAAKSLNSLQCPKSALRRNHRVFREIRRGSRLVFYLICTGNLP